MTHTDNPILGKYLGQPTLSQHLASGEELKCAYERIRELEADLLECREYIEDHVDVVDGDYGEPSPNRAMVLVSLIDERLHGAGNF